MWIAAHGIHRWKPIVNFILNISTIIFRLFVGISMRNHLCCLLFYISFIHFNSIFTIFARIAWNSDFVIIYENNEDDQYKCIVFSASMCRKPHTPTQSLSHFLTYNHSYLLAHIPFIFLIEFILLWILLAWNFLSLCVDGFLISYSR